MHPLGEWYTSEEMYRALRLVCAASTGSGGLSSLSPRCDPSITHFTMSYLSRPLTNRALHLRLTPRPSNLGESREIHRLISQFGEVEYFKSLKYDALPAPNVALVIFKEETAAKECLRRSPIRFRMGRVNVRREDDGGWDEKEGSLRNGVGGGYAEAGGGEEMQAPAGASAGEVKRGPVGTPFGLPPAHQQTRRLSTSSLPQPPTNLVRMPYEPFGPPSANRNNASKDETKSESEGRIFQLIASPSRRHFRDQINTNHYHGPFALDTKMFGHEDLRNRVPTVGLSMIDWRLDEKPWHVSRTEKLIGRKRLGEVWEEGKYLDERVEVEREGVGVGVGVGDEGGWT